MNGWLFCGGEFGMGSSGFFFFRIVGNAGLAMVTVMALNVYLRAGNTVMGA